MKEEVEAILRMAHEDLAAARRDLDAGDVRNALSRAYYATFHAASAALHQLGRAAKSPGGAHQLFRAHVVGEGAFDSALARVLPNLFQKRQEADYTFGASFDAEAVQKDVERAEAFVGAVEAWLRAGGGEG